MEIRRYSDIENLYKSEEIYNHGNVIVTEKLHGTNIRLGYAGNKFFIGGRNTIFTSFEVDDYDELVDVNSLVIENDSYGFTRWFMDKYPFTPNKLAGVCRLQGSNTILFGEFIGPSIQKGVDYGPEKSFWTFDGYRDEEWLPWFVFEELAKGVGLKRVPVLYAGKPSKEIFDTYYDISSVVGKELGATTSPNICEGIVVQPEIPARNEYGDRVIIKHKNEIFAEKKQEKKVRVETDNSREEEFVNMYVVPKRLNHVLQHLREDQGIIVKDMVNTREVIQEMVKDLKKEAPEWSEMNEKVVGNLIAKTTVAQLKLLLNS